MWSTYFKYWEYKSTFGRVNIIMSFSECVSFFPTYAPGPSLVSLVTSRNHVWFTLYFVLKPKLFTSNNQFYDIVLLQNTNTSQIIKA